MNKTLRSDLFEPEIDKICLSDHRLNISYGKVKCRFREFAESIDVPFGALRMFHISETSGGMNKQFNEFLTNLRGKKKSNRPEHKRKAEIYSISERVIVAASGKKSDGIKISATELNAPSWLEPILEILPRDMPKSERTKFKGTRKHREYPLTLHGELLLEAILKISAVYDLSCPRTLLIDYVDKLRADIRNTPRGQRPKCILETLRYVIKKLNFGKARLSSRSLKFENWPPRLKQQFEVYAEIAVTKIGKTSTLSKLADFHKMKICSVNENTVKHHKHILEIGLSHCQPLPEDCGIEDLLLLDKRKIEIGGVEYCEAFNKFVDGYRKVEQDKSSKSKRTGFDSASFKFFREAVNNIGKCNGFFHLVKDFAPTCVPYLDIETIEKKKADKKKAIALKDLDQQITLLEKDVDYIIKRGLFKEDTSIGKAKTGTALKKCLYFPILIVARFLGLRQKNIRCATLMKNPENKENPSGNIGIKKDGTLVFHFKANETKNNKTIHIEFNEKQHGKTHGMLIRGLTKYFKKVRPYIISLGATNLGEKCFFYLPEGQLDFQQFNESNGSQFYDIFTSWSGIFLENFLNVPERFGETLNPHFFRGVCCDWLHDELGLTFDEIGEYIGDLAETVRKEYIDRNRIHNATDSITAANIKLDSLIKQAEQNDNRTESVVNLNVQWQLKYLESQEKIKYLEELLKEKDRQIAELRGELNLHI